VLCDYGMEEGGDERELYWLMDEDVVL